MERLMRAFLISGLIAVLAPRTLAANRLPSAVARTVNSIRVTVDPRLELMSVVQYLSEFRDPDEPLIVKEEFPYRSDVDTYFARFRNHAAVRAIGEMSRAGCSFSWPSLSMLYLDQDLQLRRELVPNAILLQRCGGAAQLDALAGQIRSFSKDSNFSAFFEQHRAFYVEIEAALAAELDHDYILELERFYGIRYADYSMFLVPLYGPVGYGPVIETTTGEKRICAVLGTHSVRGGLPYFGDRSYLAYMQRHEFSHSFVNPLTTRFAAEAAKCSGLLARMSVAQHKGVCGDWEECLNESVVRAVTTYFALRESPEAGQKALDKEIGRGAVLTPDILAALQEYSAARNKYTTFAMYYPVLLRRLAEVQP